MKADDDPFDIEALRIPPEEADLRLRMVTPHKIRKRREHFVRIPFTWIERLDGVSGKTYSMALHLLYRNWKANGAAFKLGNDMLAIDGIGRTVKWRALAELERRGLISVEHRLKKSPIITVHTDRICPGSGA